MPINRFQRIQRNYNMQEMYPSIKGVCACGCGKALTGRKTRWHSPDCSRKVLYEFLIIKGDVSVIRHKLFEKEKGICQKCGKHDKEWQADHIVEVRHGGGGCGMENFQTLCVECHKVKTKLNSMEYYLTQIEFTGGPITRSMFVTQLVKASSPKKAREAVQKQADNEKAYDITVIDITVNETLIGE